MTVVVVLPLPLPGVDQNQRNSHWGTRSRNTKEMREYAELLGKSDQFSAWRAAVRKAPALQKYRVAYVYYCGITHDRRIRPRDPDNAIACCKPYIDGLVNANVLPGDSARLLEIATPVLHRNQKQVPKDQRGRACVEIRIEECG